MGPNSLRLLDEMLEKYPLENGLKKCTVLSNIYNMELFVLILGNCLKRSGTSTKSEAILAQLKDNKCGQDYPI